MSEDKKVKVGIKIILFIVIISIISIFVFIKSFDIGTKIAEEDIQSAIAENNVLSMNEEEAEALEEEGLEKVTETAEFAETTEASGTAESAETTEASGTAESVEITEGSSAVIETSVPVIDEIETEILEEVTETAETDLLILVNKKHKLPDDYKVELKTMYDKVNRAAKEAYGPLNDMLAAGRAEGLVFEICSSYRDVKVQERLFQEDVDVLMYRGYTYEEAYAEVAKETMPPGHSEHSTGLAFDIVSMGYQMLNEKQHYTAETQWLHEHCAEYGFILRYPKGKEEITEINYESWHYRYVGVEAATYIMEQGITLEEYLELNK